MREGEDHRDRSVAGVGDRVPDPRGDVERRIGPVRHDVVIEPQRAGLIPGFAAVKQAATDKGALGCSISGSGPTVFAWCEEHEANRIRTAMVEAFAAHGLASDHWVSAIGTEGASVVAG